MFLIDHDTGTGKSVLLREIIEWCGGRRSPYIAITASTGIASVNIGGSTLHSWAGIGLGKESAETLFYKILGQDKAYRRRRKEQGHDTDEDLIGSADGKGLRALGRWQRVRTLIIDESKRASILNQVQHANYSSLHD